MRPTTRTKLKRVFVGDDKGAHRDALLMGTSLVLELIGAAANPKSGVERAAAALDDGLGRDLLDRFGAHFQT